MSDLCPKGAGGSFCVFEGGQNSAKVSQLSGSPKVTVGSPSDEMVILVRWPSAGAVSCHCICETSQICCLMGRRPMKDVLGSHLKDPLFLLVHLLSITL